MRVENTSSLTGNTAPAGFGADVYNLGLRYLDSTSIIDILVGNPAGLIKRLYPCNRPAERDAW